MSGFDVKGWCPGALRPMLSGDGLVVRVRPRLGRFTPEQAAGIARAASAHGSGVIDLTSRANLQIRGVRAAAHAALIADLDALGLVDATEALEARRNIIVTPFADDATMAVARVVEGVLPGLPTLPGKFGFAVDCGPTRVLADASADIRIEQSNTGGLMLRAEGTDRGCVSDVNRLPGDIDRLVRAYLEGAQDGSRMADVVRAGALAMPLADTVPVPLAKAAEPGLGVTGALIGFAFGQTDAATFGAVAALGPIRLTPWRMVLVEGLAALPDLGGLVIDAADPLRRVVACTGAPGCPQGLMPTRPLARAIAASVPAGRTLHISGCTKGCAHPGVADVTLVGATDGVQVIRSGTARDPAVPLQVSPAMLAVDPGLIAGYF